MTRRIGILGGTFDPIHQGHVDLGLHAQGLLGLTTVVVVPSRTPPHRTSPAASPFHRFAMAAMTAAEHDGWIASDVELSMEGPSYTSKTLSRFHQLGWRAEKIFFVTGADAFGGIVSWNNYPEILDAAHFVVVSRPGYALNQLRASLPGLAARMIQPDDLGTAPGTSIILIEAPTANVSATDIRRRCAEGLSIDGLVPAAVGEHIARHHLYGSAFTNRRDADDHPHPAAGRLHGQS